MHDLEDHPFSPENVAYESGAPSLSEKVWMEWARRVEKILGIETLDGNQDADGYSLDFAHDEFRNGLSAEQYAEEVKERMSALSAPKL